jgi:N-glycosidase YbiA
MSSTDVILFYSTAEAWGEFSNFARYPITVKGKRWPTSEHYFQAQKFVDEKDREAVRRAKTPMLAARIGRDRKRKLRRDWESAKVSVMREAVEAKFRQHPDLQELLLSTGDAKLVEHTDNDDFWGDGGDGSGANFLGRILVELRERLRDER